MSCIVLTSKKRTSYKSGPLITSHTHTHIHTHTHTLFSHSTMEHEIACVDVSSIPRADNRGEREEEEEERTVCAVGLWTDISAKILAVPSLETLHTQSLGGGGWGLLLLVTERVCCYWLWRVFAIDILPRSILVASFGVSTYLLVALGDGTLHYFQMEPTTGNSVRVCVNLSNHLILTLLTILTPSHPHTLTRGTNQSQEGGARN